MYLTALIFGHAFNIPCKGAIEEDVFQHILLLLIHHNHIKEGGLKTSQSPGTGLWRQEWQRTDGGHVFFVPSPRHKSNPLAEGRVEELPVITPLAKAVLIHCLGNRLRSNLHTESRRWQLDMAAHAYSSSSQEMEAGGLQVRGQSELQSEVSH